VLDDPRAPSLVSSIQHMPRPDDIAREHIDTLGIGWGDEMAGRYVELRAGRSLVQSPENELVVAGDAPWRQFAAKAVGSAPPRPEGACTEPAPYVPTADAPAPRRGVSDRQLSFPRLPTRFRAIIDVDSMHTSIDAGRIAEEVVAHLVARSELSAPITLEIDADVGGRVPQNVRRIVRENCRRLRFKSHECEE
jgi:hypothetical protein